MDNDNNLGSAASQTNDSPVGETQKVDAATQAAAPMAALPEHSTINNRKKWLLPAAATLLLIVSVAGAMYGFGLAGNQPETVANTVPAPTPTPTPALQLPDAPQRSTLFAYYSDSDKQMLVTDGAGGQIAAVPLPEGKRSMQVRSGGPQALLLIAYATIGSPDPSAQYFLVEATGKVTQISETSATIINDAKSDGTFMTSANSFYFVKCGQVTCTLASLDLKTAIAKDVYSVDYNAAATETFTMQLIGLSDSLAYVMVQEDTFYKAGELRLIDIRTREVVRRYDMAAMYAAAPVVSPDLRSLVYTAQGQDTKAYVMDIATGKTSAIEANNTPANYLWSPDSSKVAFESGGGYSLDGTTRVEYIGYVDVRAAKTTRLVEVGESGFHHGALVSWYPGEVLHYVHGLTGTKDNFSNAIYTHKQVDVLSGAVSESSVQTGYKLLRNENW